MNALISHLKSDPNDSYSAINEQDKDAIQILVSDPQVLDRYNRKIDPYRTSIWRLYRESLLENQTPKQNV